MTMERRVAAVVLNYNQHAAACEAREELQRSRGIHVDVLVVDAASEANDRARLQASVPAGELLLLTENRGYAGGMNAGIEWWRQRAPDRPILLFTPDARIPDDVAAALWDELAADAGTGAVGPVIVYRDEPHTRIGAGGSIDARSARIRLLPRIASPTPYDADWVEGCCMMLRPEAIRDVAGFDEEYFLYYEEIDLCERLRRAGWRVRVVPSVRVRHPKGPGQPPHYYYYMTRNAYRFWAKHFGIGMPSASLQAVRSTAWLGVIAMRSLVVPTRWNEIRMRWRDWWLQLRGAWTGTRDHLRGRYGPQAVPTRRPG